MTLKLYSEKTIKEKKPACTYVEWDNEKRMMMPCGDPAIGAEGAGKREHPLCEFHLEYVATMNNIGKTEIKWER